MCYNWLPSLQAYMPAVLDSMQEHMTTKRLQMFEPWTTVLIDTGGPQDTYARMNEAATCVSTTNR